MQPFFAFHPIHSHSTCPLNVALPTSRTSEDNILSSPGRRKKNTHNISRSTQQASIRSRRVCAHRQTPRPHFPPSTHPWQRPTLTASPARPSQSPSLALAALALPTTGTRPQQGPGLDAGSPAKDEVIEIRAAPPDTTNRTRPQTASSPLLRRALLPLSQTGKLCRRSSRHQGTLLEKGTKYQGSPTDTRVRLPRRTYLPKVPTSSAYLSDCTRQSTASR